MQGSSYSICTSKQLRLFEYALIGILSLYCAASDVPNAAMDISSDLTELGRTPVAVISAGVKSILDIPRTLEYLVLNHFVYKYLKDPASDCEFSIISVLYKITGFGC